MAADKLGYGEYNYYDMLLPYFTYFTHTDTKFENYGKTYNARFVYISLDDLVNTVFQKK